MKRILSSNGFSIICLLAILIIGIFLRWYGVYTQSFAFTYDVGRDMLALQAIVNQHKFPLIGPTTGFQGIFYGPWWYYILLLPFILVNGNPQGIAGFMALVGISNILLGFFIGKKIQGNLLGIVLAGGISFSPAMIAVSSQIWNPNLAPTLVLLTLCVFSVIFMQSEKNLISWKYFLSLGLLMGLTIDMEIVFGLLFALSMIISITLLNYKRIKATSIITLFFGICIIFSPRIFFDFRHQFLMSKTLISIMTHINGSSQMSNFLTIITKRTQFLFDLWINSTAGSMFLVGIVLVLFTLFTVVFFWKKIHPIEKKFLVISFITIMIYFLGLTFFSHDVWLHYVVGLPIIFLLIVSICISFYFRTRANILAALFTMVIFLINFQPVTFFSSLSRPLFVGDASVYRNQIAIVDYIYKQVNGKQFKYVVYTPPVYDYTYQYLFSWYGNNTYHYTANQNAKLAFFILEPDYQYPFRLANWLKIREKDGKIINEKKFPSGIVVQTRIE